MNAPTHALQRSAGRLAQLNPFESEVVQKGKKPEPEVEYGCVDWYVYQDTHGRKFPAPLSEETVAARERGKPRARLS